MRILAHIEAILGLLLVLAAVSLVVWHKVHYHFGAVEKGRLYRSGALGRVGLWWICFRYGIRTIVCLTTERECHSGTWYKREEQFCRKRGIELLHLPMQPGSVPETRQIRRFLQASLSNARQPVLVHCKQGVARTNMMVAVYMKERFGQPNHEILQQLPSFGHQFGSSRYGKMREFILTYKTENNAGGPVSATNCTRMVSPRVPPSEE
ncbi:MAG TPA: sulfur transferase domain-containing protein [Sedimentisphaerales bacterium]|jgi:uncharacterized protein (TIGR01244 family)|nr:sulfur transferase domain-containing protein [Sedimentisphaerales bacterium]HOH66740.1 sulfur transferase domain-containing protein [Sedimentisphaerales bacterium]